MRTLLQYQNNQYHHWFHRMLRRLVPFCVVLLDVFLVQQSFFFEVILEQIRMVS